MAMSANDSNELVAQLRASIPRSMKLDADAQAALEELLGKGAARIAREPQRLGEAKAALATLLEAARAQRDARNDAGTRPLQFPGGGGVADSRLGAGDIRSALGGLCPGFYPFC